MPHLLIMPHFKTSIAKQRMTLCETKAIGRARTPAYLDLRLDSAGYEACFRSEADRRGERLRPQQIDWSLPRFFRKPENLSVPLFLKNTDLMQPKCTRLGHAWYSNRYQVFLRITRSLIEQNHDVQSQGYSSAVWAATLCHVHTTWSLHFSVPTQ
jgi:hypothetical protein